MNSKTVSIYNGWSKRSLIKTIEAQNKDIEVLTEAAQKPPWTDQAWEIGKGIFAAAWCVIFLAGAGYWVIKWIFESWQGIFGI